tara:strand:+ start:539 stop:964 length:426 start_codon:yes stop_codon:yes gene_type:complete
VNSDLIPEIGRLLECSSCNNQFFFKKEKVITKLTSIANKEAQINTDTIAINKDLGIDKSKKVNKIIKKKKLANTEIKLDKKVSKSNFLGLTIVFIITFIALIIFLDTFKYLISYIVPNIEIILYNLYETIKDIELFIKDLF